MDSAVPLLRLAMINMDPKDKRNPHPRLHKIIQPIEIKFIDFFISTPFATISVCTIGFANNR